MSETTFKKRCFYYLYDCYQGRIRDFFFFFFFFFFLGGGGQNLCAPTACNESEVPYSGGPGLGWGPWKL